MAYLYRYRGFISAALAALLLFSPSAPIFETFSFPIFAVSVFLRIWARMHIGMHSRGSELCVPQIVKSGPYAFLKHPLYLSNWLAGVSFAILHSGFSEFCIIFCVAYFAFLLLLAKRENAFLKLTALNTPRLLRSHPSTRGEFFKAILNDKWTWFWQFSLIALICFFKL